MFVCVCVNLSFHYILLSLEHKPLRCFIVPQKACFPLLFVRRCVMSSHTVLMQTLHCDTQRTAYPHPSFPTPNYNYVITLTNKQHTHKHTHGETRGSHICFQNLNGFERDQISNNKLNTNRISDKQLFSRKYFFLHRYAVGKRVKAAQQSQRHWESP